MIYEGAPDKEIVEAAKDFVRSNGWQEVVMVPLAKRIEWTDFDTGPPTCSMSVVRVHFHRFRSGEVVVDVHR